MLNYYFNNPEYAIDYDHTITPEPHNMDFHLHNRFEIYFFISGNVNYFIERKMYKLKYGDLLVFNNQEIHKPSFSPGSPYERIVIHFDHRIPLLFEPYGRPLLNCFLSRPNGDGNRISLNELQSRELLSRFNAIESIDKEDENYKLLILVRFIDLLHFINRLYSNTVHMDDHLSIPDKLIPVFDYIENNLDKDLSLEALEGKFYINRFHLSRLFKKSAGRGLHEYIMLKRISRAKMLLSEGKSVTEACILAGFNDYSNFLRIFKRTVGKTPGEYRKTLSSQSGTM